MVNIEPHLQKALLAFIEHYRSTATGGLFVSRSTGKYFSAVNRSLNNAWRLGMQDAPLKIDHPSKINMNLVRRTLVTLARSDFGFSKEEQAVLATHTDHSLATADLHYDMSHSRPNSSKCAALLHTAMSCAPTVDPIPSDAEEDDNMTKATTHPLNNPYQVPLMPPHLDRPTSERPRSSLVRTLTWSSATQQHSLPDAWRLVSPLLKTMWLATSEDLSAN